jgi:tRNA (guanine-N7-)-methyltransferase
MNQALDELLPRYGITIDQPIALAELFDPPLPVVLEIGCGMGEATLECARTQPEIGIAAIDVHTRGIATILRTVADESLANVRVTRGDAVTLLENLPKSSLAGIRIWFPDPWPKARHNKRRLIQGPFVALAASRLKPGATLHAATDWAEYADQMLEVLSAESLLRNLHDGFADRPDWRPVTRYERVGIEAQRPIADLVFERV